MQGHLNELNINRLNVYIFALAIARKRADESNCH